MASSIHPFLMFEGRAEEAMRFYVSLFADGKIDTLVRHPGKETVLTGHITISGQTVMCFDSPVPHAFTFTPSVSLFITCEDDEEFERLIAALGAGGKWMMAPDNYGFSRRFGWVADRFGVSWQVNLP